MSSGYLISGKAWSKDNLQELTEEGKFFCMHVCRQDELAAHFSGVNKEYYSRRTLLWANRAINDISRRVSLGLRSYIPPEQFAAIVSFACSIPWTYFKSSTIFNKLKEGKKVTGREFMKYTTIDGTWLPELEWERDQQSKMFEKGIYATECRESRTDEPTPIRIDG